MGHFVMPGATETELMPKHFGRKPYGRNNGRYYGRKAYGRTLPTLNGSFSSPPPSFLFFSSIRLRAVTVWTCAI